MTERSEGQNGNELTPVQRAERAFNTSLMSADHPSKLSPLLDAVHTARITEATQKDPHSPEAVVSVFDKSILMTEQAAQKAEMIPDAAEEIVLALKIKQEGLEATREFILLGISGRGETARPTAPIQVENLPMSDAKGGRAQIVSQPARPKAPKPAGQPETKPATAAAKPEEGADAEENFGQFLRGKRESKGLAQQKLAEAFGKRNIFISNIEIGKTKTVAPEIVEKLAQELGLDEAETERLQELYTAQFGKNEPEN